jgi:uncharacterized protein
MRRTDSAGYVGTFCRRGVKPDIERTVIGEPGGKHENRMVAASVQLGCLDLYFFVVTLIIMKITCDEPKRQRCLEERGLDFYDAELVFAGRHLDVEDTRFDYGETRIITFGFLLGRMVAVGWTPRGEARHVFTMRKANDREIKRYSVELGEGG